MIKDTAFYTIKVNSLKKEVEMEVSGTFTPEKAEAFIEEYTNKVNTINAADFTLRLDCTSLDVVTQQQIPELEKCYVLYRESGFKKVIFEIHNNNIVKMQLNRLARKAGLTNVEISEV